MSFKLRESVSGVIHLATAIAAAIGLAALLVVGQDSAQKRVSLFIYGSSLVLMFASSAAYHLIRSRPHAAKLLRKLDHSAIYLLIAGTYTPICIHFFREFWQWGFLSLVWSLAVAGMIVKLYMINAPRWLAAGLYLLMGWLSLMAIKEMFLTMPTSALVWLLLGGICFTVGSVVYIVQKPDFYPGVFGFHEVWHVFVILGCLCHFIVIAVFVAPHSAAI